MTGDVPAVFISGCAGDSAGGLVDPPVTDGEIISADPSIVLGGRVVERAGTLFSGIFLSVDSCRCKRNERY